LVPVAKQSLPKLRTLGQWIILSFSFKDDSLMHWSSWLV
jgi:hypothetical protein